MKKMLMFLAVLALVLSGCSILPNRELSAAQARWRNSQVSHYRYNLSVVCFCGFTQRMPLTIEVKDGTPLSMVFNDGAPVPADQLQWFSRYSTVDALFDFTRETLKTADKINVEYDLAYGFPSKLDIDFYTDAVDDELALIVDNFQPLP